MSVGATPASAVPPVLLPAAHAWMDGGWPGRFDTEAEVTRLMAGRNFARRSFVALDQPVLRVAVVGDSHANRAAAGLSAWGSTRSIQVSTFCLGAGCPPLLGISVFGKSDQSRLCEEVRDSKLRALSRERFDVVVLAAQWGLYTGTLSDPAEQRYLSPDVGGRHADIEQSRAAFLQGLDATIELVQRSEARIVFLGQFPPLGE